VEETRRPAPGLPRLLVVLASAAAAWGLGLAGGVEPASAQQSFLPDLSVQSITVAPRVPIAGQSASVTVTVENLGSGAAGQFFLDFS
jgi:hypothetical protein